MTVSFGKTFIGTNEDAALCQPFVIAPKPHPAGVIIGLDVMLNTVVTFDPYLATHVDQTHSKVYGVTGQVKYGKSAFMKMVARRLSKLKAFDDSDRREPVPFRMWIRDRKMGEYASLTKKLRSHVIKFGQNGVKLNPFDARLNMGEVHAIDMAVELAAAGKGAPLVRYEPLALQVALHLMMNDHAHEPSIERLEYTALSLTMSDVADYYRSNSVLLGDIVEQSTTDLMAQRMLELASKTPDMIGNITASSFREDAGLVAGYLGSIARGPYGRIIGGEGSMYDELTKPVVTLEWDSSNQAGQDLAEGTLYKWRSIARHNRELVKLIPHLEIGDEEHKAYNSPMYLRFRSEASREARAFHTAELSATQYTGTDTDIAGGNDPSLQALARGIENAMAGRFVFRQPENDPVALERLVAVGFSELDAERTTRLPRGWCAFKLPDRPPSWLRVLLTESDRRITYTEGESDKMVEGRRPAEADPIYRERMKLLGIDLDENDDSEQEKTVVNS